MTENIPLTSSNIFRVYYPPNDTKAVLIKSRIDNIRVLRKIYQGTFAAEDDTEPKQNSNTKDLKKGRQSKLGYLLEQGQDFEKLVPALNQNNLQRQTEDFIENELVDQTQTNLNRSLEDELNINLNKAMEPPAINEHFNSMGNFNQRSNAMNHQKNNHHHHHKFNQKQNHHNHAIGLTNTMTSQMNPAVNAFGLSGDLIETLKDPLQKHLHFGPSYQETGNVLGKRGILNDRTNDYDGYNMKYTNEKKMMFKNALDSVMLPQGNVGNNNNTAGFAAGEFSDDDIGLLNDYNQ